MDTTFEKDTESHTRLIESNDGVNRSILYSNNGSSVYHYIITTWRNHLAFSGDMGCFVFCHSSIKDMMTFFNHDKVNIGYWASKVVAGKHKQYCHDMFLDNAADLIVCEQEEPDKWAKVREEVSDRCDGNEYHSFADLSALSVYDFFGEGEHLDFTREDFSEFGSCDEPTYHFLWACEAIRKCCVEWFSDENQN